MKNLNNKLLSVALAAAILFTGATVYRIPTYVPKVNASGLQSRQVESLNRGIMAVRISGANFINWRFLATDSVDTVFELYRGSAAVPIFTSGKDAPTNYRDAGGTAASQYYVKTITPGKEDEISKTVTPIATTSPGNYFDIPIQQPAGGTCPGQYYYYVGNSQPDAWCNGGCTYTYEANDASVADLDGDGEYEIILKWEPTNARDNAHNGWTANVYIDAYKLDGTRLWRVNLGDNIRAGAHYTQFMVYDFDGDGHAEMVVKTADGTVDGKGKVIGDAEAKYKGNTGRILTGPEYLTLFDGLTGEAIHTINYEPGRGNIAGWGNNENYGNRVDRFLAGVAYLDGVTPSVVMCRGYYARSVLVSYDVIDKKLVKRWTFDSNTSGNSAYAGQGNHSLSIADVDGDGKDEIIYGSMVINHDGKGLYSTGWGHGDALHVSNFLPNRPGLEIWQVHESPPYGGTLRDAATGQLLFRSPASGDTGRGIAGNFIEGQGSAVFADSANGVMYDGQMNNRGNWRNNMSQNPSGSAMGMNFAVWFDGTLERSALDKTQIEKYGATGGRRLLTASGVSSNNGTKATPVITADIFGDWREEVIWRRSDNKALRVYMCTETTPYRIHTLMHDTQYRVAIAWQNVAYNQPPHP
ncbi:MAG: rhamnogalacturonan lyase, partial [Oscillospiraceae bacterium]|nr:rhamnogalacturonan lyase [Oscillospiraceae bacterium]